VHNWILLLLSTAAICSQCFISFRGNALSQTRNHDLLNKPLRCGSRASSPGKDSSRGLFEMINSSSIASCCMCDGNCRRPWKPRFRRLSDDRANISRGHPTYSSSPSAQLLGLNNKFSLTLKYNYD